MRMSSGSKLMALTGLLMMVASFSALAETWKHVPMVDTMCSSKAKGDPDKHTTQCALASATSGFGIVATDGTYLKFNQAGNSKAVALLKAAEQPGRIRVTLTGDQEGDTIKVTSLALDK
jgi:hypothetical protein